MLLPKISISIVTFKNNNAIIQFSKNHSRTYFSEDLILLNVIHDSPIYMYEIPYLIKTRVLGIIIYHAYILKLTPIHTKPIFNTYTNLFKIRLISNSIDWSLPQITILPTLLIGWESYLKFKSSNLSINTNSDSTPNNHS